MPSTPGTVQLRPAVAGHPTVSARFAQGAGPVEVGSFLRPPVVAGGGGGPTDVARSFTAASNHRILLNPGGLAGAPFDYGTLAVVFRKDDNDDWQNLFHLASGSGTGESGVIEIAPFDQLWFDMEGTTGAHGQALGDGEYCLLLVKPNGTVVPRFHLYSYASSSWNHMNGETAAPNGTQNITGAVIGAYPGGFDWQDAEISAAGAFRHWVPDDTAVEAAGLEIELQKWVDATANSDREAIWSLRQTSTSDPVGDDTGGGATETSSGIGTVSTGPAGFNNSLGTGAVDSDAPGGVAAAVSVPRDAAGITIDPMVPAGVAAAVSAPRDAQLSVGSSASAGVAAATSIARDAVAGAGAGAPAGVAAATSSPRDAAVSADVAPVAGVAAATSSPRDASVSADVAPVAGVAAATSLARDAQVAIFTFAPAQVAAASSVPRDAAVSAAVAPLAGVAAAVSAPRDAAVSATSSAVAGVAAATSTARDATASATSAASAGVAAATSSPRDATITATSSAPAQTAVAVSTATQPNIDAGAGANPVAQVAAATSTARDAAVSAAQAAGAQQAAAISVARDATVAASSSAGAGPAVAVSIPRDAAASTTAGAGAGVAGAVSTPRDALVSASVGAPAGVAAASSIAWGSTISTNEVVEGGEITAVGGSSTKIRPGPGVRIGAVGIAMDIDAEGESVST